MRALVVLVASVVPAAAQEPPCPACARGDDLIIQLSLQPLRDVAGELSELHLDDPLSTAQYARIVDIRKKAPAATRLGALDDADLAAIATALCRTAGDACAKTTTHALRCLADRCDVAFPNVVREPIELETPECKRTPPRKRSAPFGLGLDFGTGWHRTRYPADGRTWSLGIEARLRFARRFGMVARIDRTAGRDAAEDADDSGDDDVWTGSITRISALAGPSVVFGYSRFEDAPRFLRLDVLGGYVSTRSQADESGPAAGFDLSHNIAFARLGVRFVQGFGDASDATTGLVYIGFTAGADQPRLDDPCKSDRDEFRTRLAIGMDTPLVGYAFEKLGVMSPGLGLEFFYYLARRLDLVARGDLLLYPGYERDRTIHQAVLGGVRIDLGKRRDRSERIGYFTMLTAGYTHSAGIEGATTGSGPVADAALGWGFQARDGAVNLRLHTRFGISPDSADYRAIFISTGFELRFDPRYWRRRI